MAAAEALRRGRIVALLGVGGFQLLVDAIDEAAVARLRARKARAAKPLAVMVGSLDEARALAVIDAEEAATLAGPEGPIVLVTRRGDGLAPSVAPGRARLGLLLPTTPLHALLLDAVRRPLVATSGNRHEEPIARTEAEAHERLGGIADLFLVHDREVVRRLDDSVIQVVGGEPSGCGWAEAMLRCDCRCRARRPRCWRWAGTSSMRRCWRWTARRCSGPTWAISTVRSPERRW